MKKIISLASDFSRKLKEIVSGIKTGVQFFKDLISGRLNLKKIVDDIIVAITSIPKKVNEFHIRREPNWSKKKWSRLKYIYHWPYLYPLIFARSFHIADEHWSLLSFTSIDGLQPFSSPEPLGLFTKYHWVKGSKFWKMKDHPILKMEIIILLIFYFYPICWYILCLPQVCLLLGTVSHVRDVVHGPLVFLWVQVTFLDNQEECIRTGQVCC